MDFDPTRNDSTLIRAGGRVPKRAPLSDAEARRLARHYLRYPPSSAFLKTFELLATAGVLAAGQLRKTIGVAPRTLRKYVSLYLLDRLPAMNSHLEALGLRATPEKLRLYCLGDVGLKMAELQNILVPTGYWGPHDRITHDLLAAETILRMARAATKRGWQWRWRSRYAATIHDNRVPYIEPDGLLALSHPEHGQRVFVLEFHNEDSARRVLGKLERYRDLQYRIGKGPINYAPWLDDPTPTVLSCSTHMAPHRAYFEQLRTMTYPPHLPWCGIVWADFVNPQHDALRWLDYRANQWTGVLD